MMLTLFNSHLNRVNEYADEMTYRMSGNVTMDGAA